MAPFLQMGRIDVSAAIEEEFNAWYNMAYIPGYLAVSGCLNARRFIAVEGQPKYLTVCEFEHAGGPCHGNGVSASGGSDSLSPWPCSLIAATAFRRRLSSTRVGFASPCATAMSRNCSPSVGSSKTG